MRNLFLYFSLAIILITGCVQTVPSPAASARPSPSVTAPQTNPAPKVESPGTPILFNLPYVSVLSVTPANIESGETAVLAWEVQNSFDVEIQPGLTIIPPRGSRQVSPTSPTTYKLTANNAQGSIIATTTLMVYMTPFIADEIPVIKSFSATPYVIHKGESAILFWESINGSSAKIDNGLGIVSGSGTTQVTPAQTTTYMLTVINPRGLQFQTVTVNVK